MAQQTTLIPRAPRTSTLIVDSDLDLGAYNLTANSGHLDGSLTIDGSLVADGSVIADGSLIANGSFVSRGGGIDSGNDIVCEIDGYGPEAIGNKKWKTYAAFTLPELVGTNDIQLDFTAQKGTTSIYLAWRIQVDGNTIKQVPDSQGPSPHVSELLTGITKDSVITIDFYNASDYYYGEYSMEAVDIKIIGKPIPWIAYGMVMSAAVIPKV